MVLSQRRAPLRSRFAHKLVDFILSNLESVVNVTQLGSSVTVLHSTLDPAGGSTLS